MYNFWVIYWSNRYKLHQNAFRSLDHDHSSVSVINLIIIHVGFFSLFRLYVDGTLVFFRTPNWSLFKVCIFFSILFDWRKPEAMPSYQLNGPNFCMVKAMDIEKSRQGHHFSTKCRDACIEIQLFHKNHEQNFFSRSGNLSVMTKNLYYLWVGFDFYFFCCLTFRWQYHISIAIFQRNSCNSWKLECNSISGHSFICYSCSPLNRNLPSEFLPSTSE